MLLRQAGGCDNGLLAASVMLPSPHSTVGPAHKSPDPWQVNPLATLLMMASVAMVIVYLYGELWILGLRFNECAPPLRPWCMPTCCRLDHGSPSTIVQHPNKLDFAS